MSEFPRFSLKFFFDRLVATRLWWVCFWVILLFCFLALRFCVVFAQPIGFDEGLYGYLSRLTAQQSPYVDFFAGKTPGIFYLGALVFKIYPSIFALRIVSVVFQFLTVLALYYLCKKFVSQKAAFLAVIPFAFDPFLVLNGSYFITENFYAFFMTLSVIFYLKRWLPASGFLAALSFLFKQTGAVLGLVFLLLEIFSFKSFRQSLRRLLRLGLGFFAGVVPFLLWWLINLDLRRVYVFLVKANSWNVTQPFADFVRNRKDVAFGLMTFSMPLILLSLLGACYCLGKRRRGWLLAWSGVILLFLFVIIKGYSYMFVPLYIPAAILGGVALERILEKVDYRYLLIIPVLAFLKIGLLWGDWDFGFFALVASPSKILLLSALLAFAHFLVRRSLLVFKNLAATLFLSSLVLFAVGEYAIVQQRVKQGKIQLDNQFKVVRVVSETVQEGEIIFSTNPGLALLSDQKTVAVKGVYGDVKTSFYGLPNYLDHKGAQTDLRETFERGGVKYILSTDRDQQIRSWADLRGYLDTKFELVEKFGTNSVYRRLE